MQCKSMHLLYVNAERLGKKKKGKKEKKSRKGLNHGRQEGQKDKTGEARSTECLIGTNHLDLLYVL